MEWIIDRIENDIAVCEIGNGKTIDIKRIALPDGIQEGDVLNIFVNQTETEKRKEKINGLMNSLFKD